MPSINIAFPNKHIIHVRIQVDLDIGDASLNMIRNNSRKPSQMPAAIIVDIFQHEFKVNRVQIWPICVYQRDDLPSPILVQ